MGVRLMEFGSSVGRGVMYTIRGCLHHPFLMFIVCGVIYISRSFPFLCSLLLSASPVVVCATILLGTLLYYGQQNIHETEIEMKSKYEAVSLRNRKLIDANASVVEPNERHFVDKCGESVEKSLVGLSELDEIRVGLNGSSKGRRSSEVESESGESVEEGEAVGGDHRVHEGKGELDEEREREREKEREREGQGIGDGDGEVMADHYAIISKVIGELLESESDHDKSEADSCDSERGNREDHRHEEEEEGEGLDSGSERAESSSPDDTSVEDIMPTMLDELHPLLDEDAPQPAQMSHTSSEAALAEHSPHSSVDSADETDVQESEAADDDEDDDDKEDHTKSIITWTEEDQKNLMLVGNSEIERNQRLERILRRRRNRSMVPEINLMDFQNSDFQIAPISTARRNPFDLPQDSGPDSAPSVLSRRRTNPFELPEDLSDEDPNETKNESRPVLKPSLTRHPFLRRRDNFSVRPSIFSPNRLERRPVKIRPFFVAEHGAVNERSYSPFKPESSEQSSAPEETESVGSVEYLDYEDEDDPQEAIEDEVSNDETAYMSPMADEVPNRRLVYYSDTSHDTSNGPEVEHSDDDGVRVRDTLSAH